MSTLSITSTTVSAVTDWVVHRLGYPVVSVELDNTQLEYAFNESVEQFSFYITQWAMRNNLANALGLPSDQDFTMRFVRQDFEFNKSFAKAYSVQAGVGGDVPVHRDYFTLTGNVQDYYIPTGRVVSEILWVEPVAIDRYLIDPYANPHWATSEFGFSYMGNSLSYIVPVYWSLYHAQNFELRNKVRRGDFSYTLLPWSGGGSNANHVTLFPIPGDNDAGKLTWYFYWDENDLNKYSGVTEGEYVSNPADVTFNEIPYSAMNSWAQMWIKKYSLAVTKEILGRIRGKFNSLPIPDAEVQMDADALLAEGKDEQTSLMEELAAELEKLDYGNMIESAATDAANLNAQLAFNPGGIWVG